MGGKKKLAALTGGTGFLGRNIAQALEENGYKVRMLARSLVVHPQLEGLSPEIIPGSLSDEDACSRLVQEADLVVHCAGLITAPSRDAFMTANAHGTARLAKLWHEEAQAKPSSRFVLISSLAAREPDVSDYAASKRAGEDKLRELDGNWVILRPAAIYGPWDTATLPVFRAQKWPVQPLLAGPGARVGLIHVDDVTRAVIKLGQKGKAGSTYELCDSNMDGYSWLDIVTGAARSLDLKARPIQLPERVVRSAGWLSRFVPGRGKRMPVFSEDKVREILHENWAVDPEKIPPKSLWAPQISLEQGFDDTTSWYRSAGWL